MTNAKYEPKPDGFITPKIDNQTWSNKPIRRKQLTILEYMRGLSHE